jgi:hypothetical protein
VGCSSLAAVGRTVIMTLSHLLQLPTSRGLPPLGACVPPWQNVHQANSPAPFLNPLSGSRKPAMCSNGPLSLEAWQTLLLWDSSKPRRAGQGLRGTKAIFKSKRAAGSQSDIFLNLHLFSKLCMLMQYMLYYAIIMETACFSHPRLHLSPAAAQQESLHPPSSSLNP